MRRPLLTAALTAAALVIPVIAQGIGTPPIPPHVTLPSHVILPAPPPFNTIPTPTVSPTPIPTPTSPSPTMSTGEAHQIHIDNMCEQMINHAGIIDMVVNGIRVHGVEYADRTFMEEYWVVLELHLALTVECPHPVLTEKWPESSYYQDYHHMLP